MARSLECYAAIRESRARNCPPHQLAQHLADARADRLRVSCKENASQFWKPLALCYHQTMAR